MDPRRIQWLVQLLISMQIMIASVLLALGETSIVLLPLTLILLGVSAYFVDYRGRFVLGQRAADLVALAIMVLTTIAAVRSDRQGLLVLAANLQSHLQFVLLFQRKTPRIYWQLSLLSIGQLAIASTLVPGPEFGMLLLPYLLMGVFAFSLLLMHTETARALHLRNSAPLGSGTAGITLVGSAAAIEPGPVWKGLLPLSGALVALTIFGAGLLFLVLPRWTTVNIESIESDPVRTVGFSETVMLGELGGVIENPEVVMRVTFYRGRGERPMKLIGDPLFRGTVLTNYKDRTWSQPPPSHPSVLPESGRNVVTRQRINIEPLDTNEVFHVGPAVAIDDPDPRLQLFPVADQLTRQDDLRSRAQEFEIGTTGIRGDQQRSILACVRAPINFDRLLQPFDTDAGREQFPRIAAFADRILAERNINPANRVEAARALSDYFHTSGEFVYTLDPQQRQPDLDPLEDFVSVNRAGHCEYFAGALVLMLRSQGIPARMVVGFKGGEWNELGQYYQVQQLHAHAWVEAYLTESQVPPQEFAGEAPPEAAWLVLDPTEGTQEAGTASNVGVFGRLRQSIDYGRVLWINYVASLNAKRQRQGIYEPLAAGIEAGIAHLTSAQVWQDRLQSLDDSPLGRFWFWYRRHWFSWRGGLVAAGFCLALLGGYMGARYLLSTLVRHGWWRRSGPSDRPAVLEMLRRLENSLERLGMTRQPAQTPHEFALLAGGELADRIELRSLAPLPARIVAAFYQIRFGGRTLDKPEAEAVEHALAELELALGRSRQK
jgi:transglutaminase-like putative cysteine protease